jgi:hypothetical protein
MLSGSRIPVENVGGGDTTRLDVTGLDLTERSRTHHIASQQLATFRRAESIKTAHCAYVRDSAYISTEESGGGDTTRSDETRRNGAKQSASCRIRAAPLSSVQRTYAQHCTYAVRISQTCRGLGRSELDSTRRDKMRRSKAERIISHQSRWPLSSVQRAYTASHV